MEPFDTKINYFGSQTLSQQPLSLSILEFDDSPPLLPIEKGYTKREKRS